MMLPQHLIDFIMDMKNNLEMENFGTIVATFNVHVISKSVMQRIGRSFVRLEYKLRLTYRPTNKSMIITYDTICVSRNPEALCKHKVIAKLCCDAMNLESTITNKQELLQCGLLSYKCLIEYKNEIFKLRKVMGTDIRFDRLLECYSKSP